MGLKNSAKFLPLLLLSIFITSILPPIAYSASQSNKSTNITDIRRVDFGLQKIIDGNNSTFIWWEMDEGDFFVPLHGKPIVRRMRLDYHLYSDYGQVMEVFVTREKRCGRARVKLGANRLFLECQDNQVPAEFLLLRVNKNAFIKICELEVLNQYDKTINITSIPYSIFNADLVRNWTDGDISTCDHLGSGINDLTFPLNETAIVKAVRFYIDEIGIGDVMFEVFITKRLKCGQIHVQRDSKEWHLLECEDQQTLAEYIRFMQPGSEFGNYLKICEVQIFLKDGCEDPPNYLTVHGHLQVNRRSAVLLCDSGYTATTGNITCENNEWGFSNSSSPECVDEESENSTNILVIISVSVSVLFFVIIMLVGLAKYLIRKRRLSNAIVDSSDEHVYEEINDDDIYIPMESVPPLPSSPIPSSSPTESNNGYVIHQPWPPAKVHFLQKVQMPSPSETSHQLSSMAPEE